MSRLVLECGGWYGIRYNFDLGEEAYNAKILGNTVDGASGGIWTDRVDGSLSIESNTLTRLDRHHRSSNYKGIYIVNHRGSCQIRGNTVAWSLDASERNQGIFYFGLADVQITGNHLANCVPNFIDVRQARISLVRDNIIDSESRKIHVDAIESFVD